ncbi:unnamed protein product [Amoebophrya sp. A25]|nr:unnamed protein product [Amoebophrya sp. A25]|eukprot:GSA25T00004918001.1
MAEYTGRSRQHFPTYRGTSKRTIGQRSIGMQLFLFLSSVGHAVEAAMVSVPTAGPEDAYRVSVEDYAQAYEALKKGPSGVMKKIKMLSKNNILEGMEQEGGRGQVHSLLAPTLVQNEAASKGAEPEGKNALPPGKLGEAVRVWRDSPALTSLVKEGKKYLLCALIYAMKKKFWDYMVKHPFATSMPFQVGSGIARAQEPDRGLEGIPDGDRPGFVLPSRFKTLDGIRLFGFCRQDFTELSTAVAHILQTYEDVSASCTSTPAFNPIIGVVFTLSFTDGRSLNASVSAEVYGKSYARMKELYEGESGQTQTPQEDDVDDDEGVGRVQHDEDIPALKKSLDEKKTPGEHADKKRALAKVAKERAIEPPNSSPKLADRVREYVRDPFVAGRIMECKKYRAWELAYHLKSVWYQRVSEHPLISRAPLVIRAPPTFLHPVDGTRGEQGLRIPGGHALPKGCEPDVFRYTPRVANGGIEELEQALKHIFRTYEDMEIEVSTFRFLPEVTFAPL